MAFARLLFRSRSTEEKISRLTERSRGVVVAASARVERCATAAVGRAEGKSEYRSVLRDNDKRPRHMWPINLSKSDSEARADVFPVRASDAYRFSRAAGMSARAPRRRRRRRDRDRHVRGKVLFRPRRRFMDRSGLCARLRPTRERCEIGRIRARPYRVSRPMVPVDELFSDGLFKLFLILLSDSDRRIPD